MDLPAAIEAARQKLGLTRAQYAARIGISTEGLRKILGGGGVNGTTLARLRMLGGVNVNGRLIETLDKDL